MQKLFCLSHPEVDPTKTPELSCKVCCKIYIAEVKQRQTSSAKKSTRAANWVADRDRLTATQGYPTDFI